MNVIEKSELPILLDRLLEGFEVVAPVLRGGKVLFDSIRSGGEAALEHGNSTISPRQVVMPRAETLLTSCPGNSCAEECTCPQKRVVLFGCRPCDARALGLLDAVLLSGKDRDTYYARRRILLTVVSIGCSRPGEACFCGTTGGGPLSAEGSDLLLEERDGRYLVHTVSAAGRALAMEHLLPGRFVEPDGALPAGGFSPETDPPLDLAALKRSLDLSFDDPRWASITEKCLGCGICSFLCPSCHCFDIVDEEFPTRCTRKRVWDSCQFACFTEQASGYNPRPTGRERYRQRIMHKFSYMIDRYGTPGCVGCGRCVSVCPVNLDMRAILAVFADGVDR